MTTTRPESPTIHDPSESNMTEQTRPSEPGLWVRPGDPAVYRVWQGEHLRAEVLSGSVNQYLASQLPAGNWRKLTPSGETVSANTQRLIDLLRSRDAKGMQKYGISLDRTDLSPEQWMQHAIEELLDGAAYLEGLKRTLPAEPATCEEAKGPASYAVARTVKTDNHGEYHEYAIVIDGVVYEFHDEGCMKELVQILNSRCNPNGLHSNGERKDELMKWLGSELGLSFAETIQIADKAAEIFAGVREAIDWERLREWAAGLCKKVPELAFTAGPEREIADLIMMCHMAIAPHRDVIEGHGQVVTAEQQGRYIFQGPTGSVETVNLLTGDWFSKGYRYMRCPEFPPRPTFTAPPKPELPANELAEILRNVRADFTNLGRISDTTLGEVFRVTED